MSENVPTLSELAKNLFDAKRVEEKAKAHRIDCETAIALLVETGERESKTVDCGEGLKLTVKRGLIYKTDVDAVRGIEAPTGADIPLKLTPAKYELAEAPYEKLRTTFPAYFAEIAKHVTVTPRKVSVELKLA